MSDQREAPKAPERREPIERRMPPAELERRRSGPVPDKTGEAKPDKTG